MSTHPDILQTITSNENFRVDSYIVQQQKQSTGSNDVGFQRVCKVLDQYLEKLQEDKPEEYRLRQHNAIVGDPSAKNFFVEKIHDFLRENPDYQKTQQPDHYPSLAEALFQEVLGFGPLSLWFRNPTEGAVVNGTSILYKRNGQYEIQKYKYASLDQVNRLVRSITLRDSSTKASKLDPTSEVEMLDGTRVEILLPPLTSVPTLTFRQYPMADFTFQGLAKRRTIDFEAIELFDQMSKAMLNTVATGPVESGKSTLLKVIYNSRKPDLMVITLERDVFEIRLAQDFPNRAPYVRAIKASLEEMKTIFPHLLRMDADYMVVPEVRSGEVELLMLAAERGNGYLSTYHSQNILDIPNEFANLSLNDYPSRSFWAEYARAAKTLDCVISIYGEGGRKIIDGVYVFDFDRDTMTVSMSPWVEHDKINDRWMYHNFVPKRLEERLLKKNPEAYLRFKNQLDALSEKYPHTNPITKKTSVQEAR